jgi:surface protein
MESMFRWNQSFNCNGKDINTSVQTRKDTNGNDEKYLAWDVSNVTNMSYMFKGHFTTAFNNDIGNWNTSNVTNMMSMFNDAVSFNKRIGEKVVQLKDSEGKDFGVRYTAWNTSNVSGSGMEALFMGASQFNNGSVDASGNSSSDPQHPLVLDFTNATSMYRIFWGCANFNSPIYNWKNTGNVTSMYQMFKKAVSFNQEIRTWDVSSMFPYGTTSEMFNGATAFLSQYNTTTTNPQLIFWAYWEFYDSTAEELSWSDEDVRFEPHPNTVALWNSLQP